MIETLLPVVVGGLIGIAGGVGQALVSSKNEIRQHHLMKREEAYLEFTSILQTIKEIQRLRLITNLMKFIHMIFGLFSMQHKQN